MFAFAAPFFELPLQVLDAYPKLLSIRVESDNEPSRLLLSDDGRARFGFSPFRRAALPNGRWLEGDGLFYGSEPGTVYTSNQAARLGGGAWMDNFVPLASPRPNRALVWVWQQGRNLSMRGPKRYLALIRYEARGKRPNVSVELPEGQIQWCRGIGEGKYQIGCRNGERLIRFQVDVRDDRLVSHQIESAPVSYPKEPVEYTGDAASSIGGRFAAPREVDGGRFVVREWSAESRRWRSLPHPLAGTPDQKELPRLRYVGSRLLATPYDRSVSSWTYEASLDRRSWRKLSSRTLLTVSANGKFCLTTDPKTGEAWLERLADFAGPAAR